MKYVELVELLHEKVGTTSENIQMDISGKYPCSIQEPVAQPPFQQLLMRDQRSFGEGSSSQRHVDNSPREYEGIDVNAEISEESLEEDEPSKDDGKSESDEDINDARDFSQNDIGINLPNQFEREVSEVQNHDVPQGTLDNEEDIFMSTCESEMEYCSVCSEDATKDLEKAFQHFNHGTAVEWKHEESMSSLESCIDGFRTCRLVISVDGTHMYLLIVVGIDENDNILENSSVCYCRQKIERGMEMDFSRLMWRAASAHQVRKFEYLIWQIREENEEPYEYLMEIPLDKWTVSHDGGKRCAVLTTNLSDSFNGVLKKARGLPVTAMVRLSLEQIVKRYTYRSQKMQQLLEQDELWTERFKMKWEKNYESSKRHFVFYWNIPTWVYDVRSIQVDGTSGKWVNLHFPCSHVMKFTDRMGGLARNFVSEHFTAENYVATYSGSFSPVSYEAYWPSPNFRMESNEFYHRLNRSRTTRILNEMDRAAAVYERACGLCRQTGQDRR
ncbi:hypothetical protein H5410_028537 [Solanum commersonii]|uniref:Uncharacterized protein n=1 Tax=Solanum commersonii TaxID=4109 RepID=A0A9J5Z4A7_SOLCO|nr:hypothetical protein H5410_028537 [Solanum commersonii]